MNKGFRGARPDQWVDYTPRLDVTNNASPTAAPNVGTGGFLSGRYLWLPSLRWVRFDFELSFGTAMNNGAGGNGTQFLIGLPVPMRLELSGPNSNTGPGVNISDRVIGSGFVGRGIFTTLNEPIHFIAADTPGYLFGGRRQDWAQMYIARQNLNGQGVFQAGTSVVVKFPGNMTTVAAGSNGATPSGFSASTLNVTDATNLATSGTCYIVANTGAIYSVAYTGKTATTLTGCSAGTGATGAISTGAAVYNALTMGFTPNTSDIQIIPTSMGTAVSYWITNVTTTGFTLNASASNSNSFQWKFMGGPTNCVNPWTPWGWSSGDSIRGTMSYESETGL